VIFVGVEREREKSVMPEQSNDYNVAVFGAGGVGKSSLVLRFVKGTFRDNYVPTVEDTYRQVISCNKQVSGGGGLQLSSLQHNLLFMLLILIFPLIYNKAFISAVA